MVSFSIRWDTLFDQWGSISQKYLCADVFSLLDNKNIQAVLHFKETKNNSDVSARGRHGNW